MEEGKEDVHRSRWTKILDKLIDGIKGFIDSDDVKVYHPRYLFPMSVFITLVIVVIFLVLFIPTFSSGLRERFLAPVESADSYCDVVTNSNTGTYLATQSGYWVGNSNFSYSDTSYRLTLTNHLTTQEEYSGTMLQINTLLATIGEQSKVLNLGAILAFWMSYTFSSSQARFNLHANPTSVFNREKIISAIASVNGSCTPDTLETTYSASSGVIRMAMDYADAIRNPNCSNAFSPERFGYLPGIDRKTFDISLDVRSLITALAMNLVNIPIAFFYDPSYPDMKPTITCITRSFTFVPAICMMRMGSMVALPVFNHAGRSYDQPIPCNCRDPNIGDLSDPYHMCHLFNFMSGILYYKTSRLGAIFQLTLNYTAQDIASKSFVPMFAGSGWGNASIYTPEFLKDAYEWCYSPRYGYCSFVVFTHWDEFVYDFTVNEYFYQLRYGSCRNTLNTSSENWQKLIDVPFAPLTQEYVVCRQSLYNAVINSVGVTAGNISLVYPMVIVLFLLCIYIYQRCVGQVWPKGYHQNDKDEIVDNFATILLLLRDGKLQDCGSGKKPLNKLHVVRLAGELKVLSNQLSKQYEIPEKKRARGWLHRLRSKVNSMKLKQQRKGRSEKKEFGDIEAGPVDEEDDAEVVEEEQVELHYGQYRW